METSNRNIILEPYEGTNEKAITFHSKIRANWAKTEKRILSYLEKNPTASKVFPQTIRIDVLMSNNFTYREQTPYARSGMFKGRHFWCDDGVNWYEGSSLNSSKHLTEETNSLIREFIDACKHEDGPVVRKGSKRRNSLKRFHYKKKNEKVSKPVNENFNPAAFKTETVLPPSDAAHGFSNTIDKKRIKVTWEQAFKFFQEYVKPLEDTFGDKILPTDIRDFLDSKYGRKIADFLNSGQTLPEAVKSYSRSFMTSVVMPFFGYRASQISYYRNPRNLED